MGNIMHHRVNVVLITYLVMAMSAHECLTSQEKQAFSSELQPLESSSDAQDKDKTDGLDPNETQATVSATESTGIAASHSFWPAVLGALTAIFSIGLLIALAVRYRFFRWCLAGNSHALLLGGETASQFSQAGALEGEIPVRGMRGRMIHNGESSDDDDDNDGFIEDNYIQASVREEDEEEENQQEYAEDSDDELVIPEII